MGPDKQRPGGCRLSTWHRTVLQPAADAAHALGAGLRPRRNARPSGLLRCRETFDRRPWLGRETGHNTPFFDGLNDQLASALPGRTFRSWVERADYRPDDGLLITYEALLEIIHIHLVDVYAASNCLTPHCALDSSGDVAGPRGPVPAMHPGHTG